MQQLKKAQQKRKAAAAAAVDASSTGDKADDQDGPSDDDEAGEEQRRDGTEGSSANAVTPSSEKANALSPPTSHKALSSTGSATSPSIKRRSLSNVATPTSPTKDSSRLSGLHARQPSHDVDLTPLRIQLTSQQTTINGLNAEKESLTSRIAELEARVLQAGQDKELENRRLKELLSAEQDKLTRQEEGERATVSTSDVQLCKWLVC